MPKSQKSPHHDHLYRRLSWQELDTAYLKQLIQLAQNEDLEGLGLNALPQSPGDVTTDAIATDSLGTAELVTRKAITVCGMHLAPLILQAYHPLAQFNPSTRDGAKVQAGTTLGTLQGPINALLKAERVLLNFLQHLSGIASQTTRYVSALGESSTRLLDTRKTTPGYRMLEKYAVACGGGGNHRLGLFDRVMLKDNHLASSQATSGAHLAEAIRQVRQKNPTLAIEVEVDSLDQIPPVLEAEADILLLDNFSVTELKEAINLVDGRCYTEASGNVNLETLPELAQLGLDFISCGALIHQSTWVDIGLDWQ